MMEHIMGISILLFLTWNGAQFLNHISGNRWGTSLTNDGNHVISKLILLIQGILSGKHMGTQFNKRCELSQNTANDQQKDTPSNQALENQHFSIGCRNASFIAMADTQMAMPSHKTWCCSNTRIENNLLIEPFDINWHHLILATRHVVFHQGHPTPIVLSPWPWWNRWTCAAWVDGTLPSVPQLLNQFTSEWNGRPSLFRAQAMLGTFELTLNEVAKAFAKNQPTCAHMFPHIIIYIYTDTYKHINMYIYTHIYICTYDICTYVNTHTHLSLSLPPSPSSRV